MRIVLRAVTLFCGVAAVSCGPGAVVAPLAQPPEFKPAGQAKCAVEKSQARPLIVEWPSPDRAALESLAKKGVVAVRYVGCEMEVLRQCRAPFKYGYTGITKKRDRVTMKDADELYANIPAYAAKFEGKLAKAGELNVDMTIVGTWDSEKPTVRADELVGDGCDKATHVITALTAGAFEFFAGASAEAGASASLAATGIGAGAKSAAQRETLNQDGDEQACKSTSKDKEPPEGCGALLRVEVTPVAPAAPNAPKSAASAAPAAGAAAPEAPSAAVGACPAGMSAIVASTPGLCLDQTEVTVEAYAACVKAGKCADTGLACGPKATWGAAGKARHPINCVDLDQAVAFCSYQGLRLPTDDDLKLAAQGGVDGKRKFPWGDDAPGAQACWPHDGTCEVGRYAAGDGAFGVHDLAGNVWEWTSTVLSAKNNMRATHGGGFKDKDASAFAAAARGQNRADLRADDLGFRCAKSL